MSEAESTPPLKQPPPEATSELVLPMPATSVQAEDLSSFPGDSITLEEVEEEYEESWYGPIPPPHVLQGFESIQSGLADRIVKMAEEQMHHRHAVEKDALRATIADGKEMRTERRIGQYCGLTLGLGAIAGAALTAIFNQTAGGVVVASLMGTGGLAGLVSAFVYKDRQDKIEAEEEKAAAKENPAE